MSPARVWVAKAKRPPNKRGDSPTHARIGRIVDEMSPFVRGDIKRGIETFRDNVSPSAIERAIKSGTMDAIAKAVPWDTLPDSLDKGFAKVVKAGRQSAIGAAQELPGQGPAPVQLVLDRAGPKLESYTVTRKGIIRQATEDGTHEAVRREVHLARTRHMTPSELANNVRQVIGLNARQAVAISNYRGSLGQDIRDPETGKLTRKAVPVREREAMVQAQIDRMLDVRADNIARTELAFATNAAQAEAWRAAQDAELLPEGAGRKWLVDGNPCAELCVPMHGVVVGLDEPWVLPDGREVDVPQEAHTNCQCTAVMQLS